MVRIPGGDFWMGSDNHLKSERPRHRVNIDSFQIAAAPVRRAEYARFLAETGHEQPEGWNDPAFGDPDQPVVGVNWFDATAYCRWLSLSTEARSRFRLPTEAEWERACRGGSESEYSWGDESPDAFEYYTSQWDRPRPVGERPPNAYGLFNMGDNVHEWCLDWFAPDYSASASRNPSGPVRGVRRASRGGSWRHAVKASRAAQRSSLPPEFRYTDYGFRLAL